MTTVKGGGRASLGPRRYPYSRGVAKNTPKGRQPFCPTAGQGVDLRQLRHNIVQASTGVVQYAHLLIVVPPESVTGAGVICHHLLLYRRPRLVRRTLHLERYLADTYRLQSIRSIEGQMKRLSIVHFVTAKGRGK